MNASRVGAPENLPKERRRQVALGQLQDEVSGVLNEAATGLEQAALLQTRQGPALDGDRAKGRFASMRWHRTHTPIRNTWP
jgi:hypothetical protein